MNLIRFEFQLNFGDKVNFNKISKKRNWPEALFLWRKIMEIVIDKDYDGVRVDRYVKKILWNKEMNVIFKMFKKGDIRINGKKVKENERLAEGDVLYIYGEHGEKSSDFIKLSSAERKFVEENIVFENENYLVFYKPSKSVMHKGSGFDYGIVEMLKSHYQNNNINFVNRIDKETSGLVIAAKNLEYTRKLSEIIRDRNINKYYYVLVKGIPEKNEFKVELELNNNGQNVEVVAKGGKESLTYFTLVEVDKKNSISLLRAKLETGRKHQIRVHLKHVGLPILGDNKYGVKDGKEMFLNSYKIDIDEINLHIDRGVPNSFKERLGRVNYKK